MYNWFECKVKYTKIDTDSGKEKAVTEPYLIDAVSFTEAEARIMTEMEKITSDAFAIVNISKGKYSDTFFYDDGDYWYKCKVSILSVDEASGKEKKTANMMLIPADTVKQAYERLEESLAEMIVPWEVNSITQSPIIDLFPFFNDVEDQEEIPENLKKITDLLKNTSLGMTEIPDVLPEAEDGDLPYIDFDSEVAESFIDESEFSEDEGFTIDNESEFDEERDF